MSFWEIVWFIIICYAFIACLMIMFNILIDLFRDKSVSGLGKAIWIACLVLFPLVAALVYLIARGPGMAQRQVDAVNRKLEAQDQYIRSVAVTSSPAEQVAQAKSMLDGGTITQTEYETLKAKALA